MNIAPVNATQLEVIYLPQTEEIDELTQIAHELLSAVHGEVKVDVSFSLDLPKIAEVLKAQAIATGENSALLWALAVVESDPTKTVSTLCERIRRGEEEFEQDKLIPLHLLHKKAPECEKCLIDAFIAAAESDQLDLEDLGLLTVYCLQKDHTEAFERLLTICESLGRELQECERDGLADSVAMPILITMLFSGLTDEVRPLEDLDGGAKARLGALLISLEEGSMLVDPDNYYVARILQGDDLEAIVQSSADPIYQAMIYDAAALASSTRNPQRAEEYLNRSIDLAGEGLREISYEEASYSSSYTGLPLDIVRGCTALGYALHDIEVGLQRAAAGIENISDSEEFEPTALIGLVVLGLALYQDKQPQALQLLDALIGKAKEFEVDGVDLVAFVLSALFPERKEELGDFISEEMPQLPEISLSLKQEDLVKTLGELSQVGLLDLGNVEMLSFAATALAALN